MVARPDADIAVFFIAGTVDRWAGEASVAWTLSPTHHVGLKAWGATAGPLGVRQERFRAATDGLVVLRSGGKPSCGQSPYQLLPAGGGAW